MKNNRLGEILVERCFLIEEDIPGAVKLSSEEGIHLGEACMRLGLINDIQLVEALAEQYGKELVELSSSEVDEETFNLIPSELLHKTRVVPIKSKDGYILVTSDPTSILIMDSIERLVKERGGGKMEKVAVAPSAEIERLLGRGSGTRRMFKEAQQGFDLEPLKVKDNELERVLSVEKIAEDSSPVVKLVNTTIYDAITKRASDIHFETGDEGLMVKYRLDGVLYEELEPIEKKFQSSIISRIKVMSELDISERRIPQDGRFTISFENKTIDFRVSIMPSIHGEDAVIRILDKEHITREFKGLNLDILGFSEENVSHIRSKIHEPYGMLLVTGPTGSGKTTTLYAAISEINTGKEKIITIEDPVEYELKGTIQIPVNEKKGLTFSKGLRSILRHDPDKIMVGEIRDTETAQIALQAALTGHLVFTTVHVNSVFDIIGRFNHMNIDPYNIVTALNCVIAQRLIRLVCKGCKRPVDVKPEILRTSGVNPESCANVVFYEGQGCD
ncbi:MAG: Flp pilus assembly complex ATPase component TadA, partial [Deltaproteobacteria bacterium]|nr:Flp pilus assembly complex ATPase component TadA [Deltaproteobacteria bacterium]